MALNDHKLISFSFKHKSQQDRPNMTTSQFKAALDSQGEELQAKLNNLIDELEILLGGINLSGNIYLAEGGQPVGKNNPLPVSSGFKSVVMIPSNSTTVSTGSPQTVDIFKTLRIEVWGTGTFTLQIQGIGSSGTARNLPIWDNINRSFVASNNIVVAGFYDIDVQGYTSVQANVSAISGGNVNASGGLMA